VDHFIPDRDDGVTNALGRWLVVSGD